MRKTVVKAAAGASAVVLAAGAGAATYAALEDSPSTGAQIAVTGSPTAATSGGTVSDVYDNANDSVVEITVTLGSGAAQGGLGGGASQAQGSGFVYDTSGHVVTNAHVVENASSIQVRFANGKTSDATVVGVDPSTDLAVIDVDAPSSAFTPGDPCGLVRATGRGSGRRDREPLRAREHGHVRDRQRARPLDRGAERVHDQRRDPDRRGDQPRQLGRPAARPGRPRDRRQLADRERLRRERRRRVRRARRTP